MTPSGDLSITIIKDRLFFTKKQTPCVSQQRGKWQKKYNCNLTFKYNSIDGLCQAYSHRNPPVVL